LLNPTTELTPNDSNQTYIIVAAIGGVVVIFIIFVVVRYKRSQKLLCLDLSNKGRKTQHPPPQNGSAHHEPLIPQELIGKALGLEL